MSIRSTGFFVPATASGSTVSMSEGSISISTNKLLVNPVRITFSKAELELSSPSFEVKRLIKYDDSFMAF